MDAPAQPVVAAAAGEAEMSELTPTPTRTSRARRAIRALLLAALTEANIKEPSLGRTFTLATVAQVTQSVSWERLRCALRYATLRAAPKPVKPGRNGMV